jgi:hypothetical protein
MRKPTDRELHIHRVSIFRPARRESNAQPGKRSDQPARMVEGQRVMGWREALSELDLAWPLALAGLRARACGHGPGVSTCQ